MTDGSARNSRNHSTNNAQDSIEEDEPTVFGEYFNESTPILNRVVKKIKKYKGIKMFGKLFEKLTGKAQELATTALNASDKDVMEAMMASSAIVAAADGDISDEEISTVSAMIKNSDQLADFQEDAPVVFNKYCAKLQNMGRMGQLDVMKEITDVEFNSDDHKVRVLLMAIEVADADNNIDDDEMKALGKIAKALDLNLSDYI